MSSLKSIFLKEKSSILIEAESALAPLFERLFMAWISGIAAFVFIGALALALFGVLSWLQLLFVYGGIGVITLALAFLVFLSKRND